MQSQDETHHDVQGETDACVWQFDEAEQPGYQDYRKCGRCRPRCLSRQPDRGRHHGEPRQQPPDSDRSDPRLTHFHPAPQQRRLKRQFG